MWWFDGLVAQLCLTLATLWTAACQAPLSMGFSKQGYWSGLPFSSPGALPDPGMEPSSPALVNGSFATEPTGKSFPSLTYRVNREDPIHATYLGVNTLSGTVSKWSQLGSYVKVGFRGPGMCSKYSPILATWQWHIPTPPPELLKLEQF